MYRGILKPRQLKVPGMTVGELIEAIQEVQRQNCLRSFSVFHRITSIAIPSEKKIVFITDQRPRGEGFGKLICCEKIDGVWKKQKEGEWYGF